MHKFMNWRIQVSYPEGDISPFDARKSLWTDSSTYSNFRHAWVETVRLLEDRLENNCAVEIRLYLEKFVLLPRPWENDYSTPVQFTVFHHRSSFAFDSFQRFHLEKAPIVIAIENLTQVAVVTCCGLGKVFELTQHQPDSDWQDNPGVKATRKARSTSVGDVVQDPTGQYFLCGANGWERLTRLDDELIGQHTPRFKTTRHDPFGPS